MRMWASPKLYGYLRTYLIGDENTELKVPSHFAVHFFSGDSAIDC